MERATETEDLLLRGGREERDRLTKDYPVLDARSQSDRVRKDERRGSSAKRNMGSASVSRRKRLKTTYGDKSAHT